jgi:hypothetical protein
VLGDRTNRDRIPAERAGTQSGQEAARTLTAARVSRTTAPTSQEIQTAMVKYFEAETSHGMPRHTRLHVSVAKRFLRRCEKLFFEVDENRAHSRSCLDGSRGVIERWRYQAQGNRGGAVRVDAVSSIPALWRIAPNRGGKTSCIVMNKSIIHQTRQ